MSRDDVAIVMRSYGARLGSVGSGLDDGSGHGWGTPGVVAPVYGDFVGKRWECLYPRILDNYYRTVASLGGHGTSGFNELDYFYHVGTGGEVWQRVGGKSIEIDVAGVGTRSAGGLSGLDCVEIDKQASGTEAGVCLEQASGRAVPCSVGVAERGGASGPDGVPVGKWNRSNKKKRERKKSSRLVSSGSGGAGLCADEGVTRQVVVECGGDLNPGAVAGGELEVVGSGQDGEVVGACCADVASGGSSQGVIASESSGFDRRQFEDVVSVSERKQLAREWYERKRAENRLATQRANYNFKRNEYLDRARISEKRWEQERLTCEQKLARISEARFGSKPGYAETLASISDGSELPPSLSTGSDSPANLSEGTVSPNSSMSVAEENRLKKKVEELSGEVAQMKLERVALNAAMEFSKGHAEVENGKVHVYDGSGQYVPPSLSGVSQPSVCFSDYL